MRYPNKRASGKLDTGKLAIDILRDVGVKQYYVEFTDNGDGGYISKVCRRKREIPYIDIAIKYPTSEIDADGKYDISVRKEQGKLRHPTDIPEIEEEYVTPNVQVKQDTQITKPVVDEVQQVQKPVVDEVQQVQKPVVDEVQQVQIPPTAKITKDKT